MAKIHAVTLDEAQARIRAVIELAKTFTGFRVEDWEDVTNQHLGGAADAVRSGKERDAVHILQELDSILRGKLYGFFRNSTKFFTGKINAIPADLVDLSAAKAQLAKVSKMAAGSFRLEEVVTVYNEMHRLLTLAEVERQRNLAERIARHEAEKAAKKARRQARIEAQEAAREQHRIEVRRQATAARAQSITDLGQLLHA